jgi:hypothetical protein
MVLHGSGKPSGKYSKNRMKIIMALKVIDNRDQAGIVP